MMWGGGEQGDQLHQLFSLGRNCSGSCSGSRRCLCFPGLKAELGMSPWLELPLCLQHVGSVGASVPVTTFFRNTGSRGQEESLEPLSGACLPSTAQPRWDGDSELLEEPPTLSHPLSQWEPWDIFHCPSQTGWPIWERALSNDDSILPGEVSPPRQPSRVRVQFAFLQHRGKILPWVTQIFSQPDAASLQAAEGSGTSNHRAPKLGGPEQHQRWGLYVMLMPSVGRNRGWGQSQGVWLFGSFGPQGRVIPSPWSAPAMRDGQGTLGRGCSLDMEANPTDEREALEGPFPLLCARSCSAALISMCIHIRCHLHPNECCHVQLPQLLRQGIPEGQSQWSRILSPHPTGTRHPFDQVATCPPTVKQGTGKPRGRSFPWGVKCPIRSRRLCAEAPSFVWLPAGPRRTVWTHLLNKRVTGAAVSSSPVNKCQRALSAAGIIDQPLNSASLCHSCNSHTATEPSQLLTGDPALNRCVPPVSKLTTSPSLLSFPRLPSCSTNPSPAPSPGKAGAANPGLKMPPAGSRARSPRPHSPTMQNP